MLHPLTTPHTPHRATPPYQGELLGLSLLQLCDVSTLRRTFDELLIRHRGDGGGFDSSSSGGSGSSDEDVAAPPSERVVVRVGQPMRLPQKKVARPYNRPWAEKLESNKAESKADKISNPNPTPTPTPTPNPNPNPNPNQADKRRGRGSTDKAEREVRAALERVRVS